MERKMIFKRLLNLCLLSLLLMGCVGAVNENQADVDVDQDSLIADVTFDFAGVEKVEALSDTRLAVYFKPAINRSSIKNADTDVVNAEFVYQVHKDGDEEAFTSYIDLNLRLNSEGYYVGEVEMDGRGDCASLSMSAKRFTNPGQIVYSSKYLLGCAKSEYYPSFSGIFSASAPTGCSAYSGVNLTWKVAENSEELDAEISRYENLVAENLANYSNMTYAEFIANDTAYKAQIETLEEYEPASYKIYYSTNEDDLIEMLSSSEIPASVITIDNANLSSYTVSGLTSGETYFFAIRSSTGLISSTNKKNLELNSTIIEYTVASKTEMSFAGISTVDIPSNTDGYNSAVLRFNTCEGCDKYHFYAKTDNSPLSDSDTPLETVELQDEAIESYQAIGLAPNTPYYFYVVAEDSCGASGEAVKKGSSISVSKITTPDMAPFNGVNDINEITGKLDRLELSWELPDTTSGVFGNYLIYKVDEDGSNPVELTKAYSASGPYISSLSGHGDPDLTTTSSVVILNLEAGADLANANKYCFKVTVAEDAVYGSRVKSLDDLPVYCHNFYYKAPNFAGPSIGTCNVTGSTFNVSYTLPTTGTYEGLRLYYKIANGDTSIDYATAESDTTSVTDGISSEGTNGFTRIEFELDDSGNVVAPIAAGDVSVNPFTVTGLLPATQYIFAMETYYDPDGEGGAEPYYVRPSVFRTCTTSEPEVIHNGWEHILALGIKHDGINNVDVNEGLATATIADQASFMSGAVEDDVALSRWFIEEKSGTPMTEGIVQLSWYDFKIAGLGTYANSLAASNTMEYVVERSKNADMSNSTVLGTVGINEGVYLYHFSDETNLLESTPYYYRVKLRKNNLDVSFSMNSDYEDIQEANEVLKVIVPPKNMAFIHRYMFNKHQCTRINKAIDHGSHIYYDLLSDKSPNFDNLNGMEIRGVRGSKYLTPPTSRNYDIENNYRCRYNGFGSKEIDGNLYWDIGKHFLIDRFGVGVNVGVNACNLDSGGDHCINYWKGTSQNTSIMGTANNGTVYYHLSDYHWLQDLLISVNTSYIQGTDWKRYQSLTDGEKESYIPTTFSNNAYLPPARLPLTDLKMICESREVTIDGTSYSGRIPSRLEYIVAGAWNDNLSPVNTSMLETRLKIDPSSDVTRHGCLSKKSYYANRSWSGFNYDVPDYKSGSMSDFSFDDNDYPRTPYDEWAADNSNGISDASPYFKTGSYTNDELEHSSHFCTSKFGVQDVLGNARKIFPEKVTKPSGSSADYVFDLSFLEDDQKDYWLNTARATLPPTGPLASDYYGPNWTGSMYSRHNTQGYSAVFFNSIIGMPLSCVTDIWGYSDGNCYDNNEGALNVLKQQADLDNYLFGWEVKSTNGGLPESRTDFRPTVLQGYAQEQNYNPFTYIYRKMGIDLYDNGQGSNRSYYLFLGTGMESGDENLLYDSLQSVTSTVTWYTSGKAGGGTHCIIPIEEE